jgi:hypothetical protein
MAAKITSTKQVEKLTIVADGLDRIGVFIEEDWGPGQARITIEVFGEAWTFYWGSMGEGVTLRQFFTDVPYLAQKFCRGDIWETNYRELADKLGECEEDLQHNGLMHYDAELRNAIGDDWYLELPQRHTHEFTYLKRIVNAIIEAFATEAEEA